MLAVPREQQRITLSARERIRRRIGRNLRWQRFAATVSDSALDHFAKKSSQRQTDSSSGALRIRKQRRVDYEVDVSAAPRWHARKFYHSRVRSRFSFASRTIHGETQIRRVRNSRQDSTRYFRFQDFASELSGRHAATDRGPFDVRG